jgi:hypothetical protein
VEDAWLSCHQRYVKEVYEAEKHGGWDVLFYGDSIIEEWRCTVFHCPTSRSEIQALKSQRDSA